MQLQNIAAALVAPGKGILAADESDSTCAKRFDKYGIEKTSEMRRAWRELLFATPNIEHGLSGVILFDETLRQKASTGEPFAEYLSSRGILPGIKVDQKTEACGDEGEEATKGLDGLHERLREYVAMGAKFTKWRAVIRIDEEKKLPTDACIHENAKRMARYAKQCQDAGLVPIIEPELLLDGTHTLEKSEAVITKTLRAVFDEVKKAGCELSGLLLKSSMALPGKDSGRSATPEEIAAATLRAFNAAVPREVPGIVFLSGGQTAQEATIRLNEIVKQAKAKSAPWRVTFSYSRALQDTVMKAWLGKEENIPAAQKIFQTRVKETASASEGQFA